MKDFKYCIWLTPIDSNDIWYTYTNGFEPHVTLCYNLDEHSISDKINTINDYQVDITLEDEIIESCESGFYALYFKIKDNQKKKWFPKDAHVSFLYKYSPITELEKENLIKKITTKTTKFGILKVKKCTGHFKEW